MDIGHAYNRLEISDRTVDDEMVLVAFNTYALETPSQLDDLRKALKAIAISRNSRTLLNELGMTETLEKHSASEWPVGLENIGNTCYLNSLLQCYFTVRPLRELVSNFENYRMSVDAQSLASKQVGSRQVSRLEVERAQKCKHVFSIMDPLLKNRSFGGTAQTIRKYDYSHAIGSQTRAGASSANFDEFYN